MTEKIDFLISPLYWVPAMSTIFSSKLMRTAASEWVPWTSGLSLRPGATSTEKSCGSKSASWRLDGRTSSWREKSAWLARSHTMKNLRHQRVSAPAIAWTM